MALGAGSKLSDDQPVSVTVTPLNDAPVANDVSVTTPKDTSVVVNFNCSDPDGDPLSYSVVSDPTNGTLTGSGASRTYTPASGYTGPDSFTYKGCDDKAACSDPATVTVTVTATPPEELTIDIDIKPGSEPNPINLKSNGVIPVAILTTDAFDASDVDPPKARFEGAPPVRWMFVDVDGDRDLDLLLYFRITPDMSIVAGQEEACLTAETFDHMILTGCDSIKVVPAKGAGMAGVLFGLGAPPCLLGIGLGRDILGKVRRRHPSR